MAKLTTIPTRLAALEFRTIKPASKRADSDLLTIAHRQWSRGVIDRSGGRCQHCGAVGSRLVADHIRERRDAPELALDPANGQALCWPCHTRKTALARQTRMRR